MNQSPVCVIGAGSWGTALAMVLSRHGRDVRLLAHIAKDAENMQQARENSSYLPEISFPDTLTVTADLNQALDGVTAVVLATPCFAAEVYLPTLAETSLPVIAACKGLHPETLERVDELLIRHLGTQQTILLSGPSFAKEVALGQPTAITMAASDIKLAEQAAELFDDSNFRVYTSTDLPGVALGGSLKNIIAIAAGIADGLNLGHNATAALITRGIVEISRLAMACGAQQETLNGLSGLGDLILTCTGTLSRNRKMGTALAQGMDSKTAREHVGQVVEGERTALAACKLAKKLGVDMPITITVNKVLQGELSPQQAVHNLMTRPEKVEAE